MGCRDYGLKNIFYLMFSHISQVFCHELELLLYQKVFKVHSLQYIERSYGFL